MSRNLRDVYFARRYFEEEIDLAFLRGLKQGRIEGYDKGFDEGEFQGFNGRKQRYDNWFNDGKNLGYKTDMTQDTTNANKISKIRYNKLMKMAIKPVIRKDIKKDMTTVKKNTMAQL